MKDFFLILIILLLSVNISAQILNVEKFRPDRDTSNIWFGTINIGLSAKKQITNVISFNTDLNVAYMSGLHNYLFLNHISLIKISEQNVISEGYFHFRLNLFRKQFLSYEPFLQIQYDLGRGLEERELAGFTFRFNIKSNDRIVLAFNTGAMYEHEYWVGDIRRYAIDKDNRIAETKFIKSSSNLSIRYKIKNGISVFSLTYYQARFENFFSPRIISDTQLQFTINKYLSFTTQYVFTFDNNPIINNTQMIYSLNQGIVIKFP